MAGAVPRPCRQGHSRHSSRKIDAQNWLDSVTPAVQTGT